VTTELPAAAVLAWWCTAWLRGQVVTDLLLDGVGDARPEDLLDLLVEVRRAGATDAGLALPVPGDPLGLGGPLALNTAAIAAGSAVIFSRANTGLVPLADDDAVTWQRFPADRRQLPDVGEADRELRRALTTTAGALAALDVARWRPEVADELIMLRRPAPTEAPAGTPPVCVQLAVRGMQAARLVELALLDDGAAVSASEIASRREALQALERAARRALVAACSPEVWPVAPSPGAPG
jgi:hypothetical protein